MTQMQNLNKTDSVSLNNFQTSAKEWVKEYVKLHQSLDATPYMHILIYHVCDSVKLNGAIAHFTMQGLEKLNDNTGLKIFHFDLLPKKKWLNLLYFDMMK